VMEFSRAVSVSIAEDEDERRRYAEQRQLRWQLEQIEEQEKVQEQALLEQKRDNSARRAHVVGISKELEREIVSEEDSKSEAVEHVDGESRRREREREDGEREGERRDRRERQDLRHEEKKERERERERDREVERRDAKERLYHTKEGERRYAARMDESNTEQMPVHTSRERLEQRETGTERDWNRERLQQRDAEARNGVDFVDSFADGVSVADSVADGVCVSVADSVVDRASVSVADSSEDGACVSVVESVADGSSACRNSPVFCQT